MPREHFINDWSFAVQGQIVRAVQGAHRSDLHRWPIARVFNCTAYEATPGYWLLVWEDPGPSAQIPTINSGNVAEPWPEAAPRPLSEATIEDLAGSLEVVRAALNLADSAVILFLKVTEAPNLGEDWDSWTDRDKDSHAWQLDQSIKHQLAWVRGFDMTGGFVLPPGYEFLASECEAFFVDHPRFDRTVFLMTRFDAASRVVVELDSELRRVLRQMDLDPVRADDKMYMPDRNLWNNVCVYMLCSRQGIAVLEDRAKNEFNPNVAIEYGFMRALNKSTLLLTDSGFRNLRADVIGTLREEFDLFSMAETIEPAVGRWVASLGL